MPDEPVGGRPRYRPLDIPRRERTLTASWLQRSGAFLLDALVFVVLVPVPVVVVIWWRYGLTPDCDVVGGIELCNSPGGEDGARLSRNLFWSLTAVFLAGYSRQLGRGETIGRRATHYRVVDDATGEPIGFGRALLRTVVMFVGIVALGAGIWTAMVDRRARTWHDLVSRSRVVAT